MIMGSSRKPDKILAPGCVVVVVVVDNHGGSCGSSSSCGGGGTSSSHIGSQNIRSTRYGGSRLYLGSRGWYTMYETKHLVSSTWYLWLNNYYKVGVGRRGAIGAAWYFYS